MATEFAEGELDLPDMEDAWINQLSQEQLKDECERRGISSAGILPILRARLKRYERAAREMADVPIGSNPDLPTEKELQRLEFISISQGARPRGQATSLKDFSRIEIFERERDERSALKGPRERESTPPRLESHERRRAERARPSQTAEIYNALRRWNLRFSGAPGTDANEFLDQIREGREILAISDEDILRCMPFLLDGIPRIWFRSRRARWTSWSHFERDFRERFGAADYQYALRDQILRRTQGEKEPVADYVACMIALFEQLAPAWSLTEQLDHTYRNLLPSLQIVIRRGDFANFDALELLARQAERGYAAAERYRAPPPPERSICPALAYRPPTRSARSATAMAADWDGEAEEEGENRFRSSGHLALGNQSDRRSREPIRTAREKIVRVSESPGEEPRIRSRTTLEYSPDRPVRLRTGRPEWSRESRAESRAGRSESREREGNWRAWRESSRGRDSRSSERRPVNNEQPTRRSQSRGREYFSPTRRPESRTRHNYPRNNEITSREKREFRDREQRAPERDYRPRVREWPGQARERGNTRANEVPSVQCWRCGKQGHIARECRTPRKFHCYRCGEPDQIARTCSRCAGNGK